MINYIPSFGITNDMLCLVLDIMENLEKDLKMYLMGDKCIFIYPPVDRVNQLIIIYLLGRKTIKIIFILLMMRMKSY